MRWTVDKRTEMDVAESSTGPNRWLRIESPACTSQSLAVIRWQDRITGNLGIFYDQLNGNLEYTAAAEKRQSP